MKKYLKTLIAVVIGISAIVTLGFTVESHYATKVDLGHFQQITEQNFLQLKKDSRRGDLENRLAFLTDRKFQLRDLMRKYPHDNEIKRDYAEVLEEIKRVLEDLAELNKV